MYILFNLQIFLSAVKIQIMLSYFQLFEMFKQRIYEHILAIKGKKLTACAIHFNLPEHSLSDFRAHIIEKVTPNNWAVLKEREEMFIRNLQTKRPLGINKADKSKNLVKWLTTDL